ncbi:hypothetical protein GCM10010347_48510 [Streptomyces cirratus]|uniref:Uncharacterized protein n=1 Tax=Streptomyces cirratus TaxID=68187 RepID=A0ABQ3EXW8_9ACTN|nr:hypothetical protein [Streptomyces cirratus]GHB72515.1 hypothetical protein GCM10010347_48510 [Streptomyces cirratus]
MSTAPASDRQDPADPSGSTTGPAAAAPATAAKPQPRSRPKPEFKPKPKLDFGDPLDQQSSDDTDRGWGERPPAGGSAADLARFLDEKPPHHA